MELLLLFASSLLLPPVMRWYVHYLEPQGDRHDGFERWCAARPMVFAVLCARRGAEATLRELTPLLAHGWVNHAGCFPWSSYRLTLVAEPLCDDVIAVRIAKVRVVRGRARPRGLAELIAFVGASRASIDEVWLHGHLHAGDEADDPEVSWLGHRDREGAFVLRAARELPYWLMQTRGKGPPRRDREDQPEAARDTATATA